jgi:hypothetical protein
VRKLIKRLGIAALVLLVLFKVPLPTSWADVPASPGSGVNLAYKLIGTANHAAILLCDAVLGETQCATVTPANALKVDASAVTQPVSATALPLPTGASTAALQAGVAQASFQATNTATTAHTCSVGGYSELGCLGQVDDDIKGPVSAGTARIGYTSDDPCTQKVKLNLAFSQNGTASIQQIALSGTTTIYVCSLSLIAAGATTWALTTGTGAACVTGNAAVIGTTTAGIANSLSLAANGGLTLGSGAGTVAFGAVGGALCMVLGTSVIVAGNLTYVQQ